MIEEIRQSIIQENNTAQQSLEFILEQVSKDSSELIFTDIFHGDIDFAILSANGFDRVDTIHFATPGEITSIKGLPARLEKFICPRQLLVEFNHKLPNIIKLDLARNHIESIDLSEMSKIRILNLNENRVSTFKTIPNTLEELYVNYTQIRTLNLKDTPALRILHASGNKMIRLQNVPSSIVDLRFEDDPAVDVEYSAIPGEAENDESIVRAIDYNDALFEYFQLKHTYDSTNRDKRSKMYLKRRNRKHGMNLAKEYRPKCIKCARPFGTIFEQRDRRYIARCGNIANPCGLKIQLFRGNTQSTEDTIRQFRNILESTKQRVISGKLETLFGYSTEEDVAEYFKEDLASYINDNRSYKDLLSKHEELHYSPHKRELIRNKITQIYELKYTMNQFMDEFLKEEPRNTDTLRTINEMYINEYLPELHNLQLLKYDITEINTIPSNRLNRPPIEELFQREVALHKLEYVISEPPRVVEFHK